MATEDDERRRRRAGTWREPGLVILDEQGYDRDLTKASVVPGWATILDDLLDAKPAHVRIVQVKEKFGTLNVYAAGNPTNEGQAVVDAFERAIDRAQGASKSVCDHCGAPGRLRDGDWYRTLCDTHANGRPPFRDRTR